MPSSYPKPEADLKAKRLERVREALARDGLSAIIVSSPENVLYTTGYESMPAAINRSYLFCAIVTQSDLILICPAIDVAAAVGSGLPRSDVYPFGLFYFAGNAPGSLMQQVHTDFAAAFGEAMRRVPTGRIAVEAANFLEAARAHIPGDAAPIGAKLMLGVRAVKLPGEIALMRAAAEMTERAIDAGIAATEPGKTDKQIAAVVAAEMSAAGGFTRNVTVVGGLHSAYADAFPGDRTITEGDLLRFDVGCSYHGYKSDLARTAVVGRATALQQERYDALRAGLKAEFEVIRAGVRTGDVFEAGISRIHALGFDGFRRHHLGHAIGLAVYEHPVITPKGEDRIELGSVFCLETPYYEPGWGGMMCEDTGVVTETGIELFSSSDGSLRQIG